MGEVRHRLITLVGAAALGSGSLILAAGATPTPAAATLVGPCGTSGVFSSSGSSAMCTYSYTGSADTFTVPTGVTQVTIDAEGAQGGDSAGSFPSSGGAGAELKAAFSVNASETLNVLVGGAGSNGGRGGGGGGGSFVYTSATSTGLLMAAAGGGGAAYAPFANDGSGTAASVTTTASDGRPIGGCAGGAAGTAGDGGDVSVYGYLCEVGGSGGGGLFTDGQNGPFGNAAGGKALVHGAAGGTGGSGAGNGGFGGGGVAYIGGGGGGGYNGGGGGAKYPPISFGAGGGGGGSFSASTPISTGTNTGNGQVVITYTEGAAALLVDLATGVQGVGPGTSLLDKVNQAQSSVAMGDTTDACGVMNGFINEVKAQTGKHMDPTIADMLITDAQQIRAVLGC